MCANFTSAVRAALPHATLVVDHFHVVQLANQARTEIRRRLTVQIRGRRGRKGNREGEPRNRLTHSAARRHGSQLDPMLDDLHALPTPAGQARPILTARNAREDLLDLLALARTHPDRSIIAARLFRFYDRCSTTAAQPPTYRTRTPGHHHRDPVAPDPRLPPNGHHQRRLRVINTTARDAYGLRDPENQRLRTPCATTRRGRGNLNPA
ncbi:transposase [Nonomuraea sp. KM90]|uniref:transposase n=1 Tax=Nonomuraea sp. KM90 TaxID=3457428 RepID=UPI003FCC7335